MNTVAEMREVAKRMGLTGTSKLRKSDLFAAIRDGIEIAHAEALEIERINAENATAIERAENALTERIEREQAKRGPKSYTQRMISRCEGYMRQNGHEYSAYIGEMIARFTPAQRRRYNKKVRAFNANH